MIFHLVTLVTLTSEVCALPMPEENSLFLVGKCSNMLSNYRIISFIFFKENSCLLFLYPKHFKGKDSSICNRCVFAQGAFSSLAIHFM